MPRIETSYYEVHHKFWIFEKGGTSRNFEIYFNTDTGNFLTLNIPGGKYLADMKIEFDYNQNKITLGSSTIYINYSISKINFRFTGVTYSPAIAIHWTFYKITYSTNPDNPNFSLKRTSICSYSNPCIKGYACSLGVCVKCHPSCFDCINGALSTDCKSQCSPISSQKIPNRGSFSLGYVDLSQFEDFDIIGIVPPFRNGRLTTSFWFYLAEFPKQTPSIPQIHISYDPNYTFLFNFSPGDLTIEFKGITATVNKGYTWYFIKGGCSIQHGNCFLFVKYLNGNVFSCPIGPVQFEGYEGGSGGISVSYYETTDYSTISVSGFNNIVNKDDFVFKFYIKEFILFREYLPEPYDNKYFSYENLLTSSFELPEVIFIIPFDELIKNDDKYDVKCYSYTGSKIESSFTLTPEYEASSYSLIYPPKNFRLLNLLGKNQK